MKGFTKARRFYTCAESEFSGGEKEVKTTLFDAGIEMDTFSIYLHLTKLIEVAHLIDVREINHVGGRVKNRLPVR